MIHQVSPEEMKEIVEKKRDEYEIIDVRTPGEYAQYRIKHSKLIPMNEIPARINEINKNKKVLVYCHSGNRSLMVAQFLLNNGFKEVYNLEYGIMYCPREIIE